MGRADQDQARHGRVRELFHRACELEPASRAHYLDAMCGDDADIRRELESLFALERSDLAGVLQLSSELDAAETRLAGSADLPPTDGLRYRLADGARVIVRPSGTEPKLKCYLEVVVPVDPDAGVDAARIAAAGRLDALRDDVKAAAGI